MRGVEHIPSPVHVTADHVPFHSLVRDVELLPSPVHVIADQDPIALT